MNNKIIIRTVVSFYLKDIGVILGNTDIVEIFFLGGNGQRLIYRELRLNIRKHFFIDRMVEHWNKLLRRL